MDIQGRLDGIYKILSRKSGFVTGDHKEMQCGKESLGYYTNDSIPDEYFVIKYADVEVTRLTTKIDIEYQSYKRYETFNMDEWLTKVEKLIKVDTITVNGKKYVSVEE